MARKRKGKNKKILALISGITALVAAFMIFAPTLGGDNTLYTGINITFGKEIINFYGIASGRLEFNILSLLAYSLPLLAFIALLILKSKLGLVLSFAFILASLIIFITMPDFVKVTIKLGNIVSYQTIDWQLLWGWTAAVTLLSISLAINLLLLISTFVKD